MDFILGFFLWISILFQILWCLESLDVCTDRDVKLALQSCDPILSEISTFILQTPSNGSYSEACSAFTEYCLCVEPQLQGCQSVLIKQYELNQETYTTNPYNCEAPTHPPYQEVFVTQKSVPSSSVACRTATSFSFCVVMNILYLVGLAL